MRLADREALRAADAEPDLRKSPHIGPDLLRIDFTDRGQVPSVRAHEMTVNIVLVDDRAFAVAAVRIDDRAVHAAFDADGLRHMAAVMARAADSLDGGAGKN